MLAAIFCLGNLTAASSEAAASSSDELLAQAAAAPAPCWKYLDEKYSVELKPVFALQYLAVAAHESPNQVVAGRTLAAHVAGKLRSILVSPADDANAPSREPPAQGGIGGWTHNTLAQCLLIARRTPAIWIELQPVEHQRADLLMHALALAAHYSLDDENDFYVLLDGKSHYHRSWNPNHVGGQVGIIVAASLYFGADALNAFFEGFAFDRFERELAEANFRNIRRCWTRDARIKELLMHGGTIALADNAVLAQGVRTSGKGVRNRFSYEGIPLEDPWKLYRAEALRLYSKAARTIVSIQGNNTSRLLGRASTAAVSPWEGQMGMCHEFESTDWDGMRTSAIYAYEGVMIDLSTASALKILGEWRASDGGDLIERRMGVGLADLRFKVREGYRGWSGGKEHFTWWEKDLEPMGAGYVFGLWENYFSPPSPPLSAH
jgi:hypothetical protein